MQLKRALSKTYELRTVERAFSQGCLFYTNVLLSTAADSADDLLEQSYEIQVGTLSNYEYHCTAHMGLSGMTAGILCHNGILSLMHLKRALSRAYESYRRTIKRAFSQKYLCYTNVFLSTTVSSTGDLLEQSYEKHYDKSLAQYDFHRSAQMAVSGMTAGILCHNWYKILDNVITGKTFPMVVKKLLLDQLICSPIIILSFFATVAIFEDNPLEDFNEEVRDKFWTLYKAEWIVWPPAQIINFYFVPNRYRVVYDNFISLGYDVYTSHIKHDNTKHEVVVHDHHDHHSHHTDDHNKQ